MIGQTKVFNVRTLTITKNENLTLHREHYLSKTCRPVVQSYNGDIRGEPLINPRKLVKRKVRFITLFIVLK